MHRALTLTSLVLVLCACNGASKQSTNTSEDDSTQQPDPAPEVPPPPANTFVAPSADELTALASTLETHLAAAREASDPAARIAALERAVAIDPFDATTLAELGHGYSAAGALPEAVHAFDLALRHADDIPQRAAVLLDLGVAAETLGNLTRAAELYQSSVLLHSTDAAAARLDAVTHGVEVISHSNCGWTSHGAAPAELCPAYVQARDVPPGNCVYTHPPLTVVPSKRVELFAYLDPSTATEIYVINVILDDIWYSSPLTWVSHPEAKHADENISRLDLRLERVAPGPELSVLIEWDLERRTVDPATASLETRTTTNLGVLSVLSLEPRWWLGLRTASTRSVQPLAGGSEPVLTQTSVELKWIPKVGDFELLRTEHSPSTALGKFVLGTYLLLCPIEIDGS